MPRIHDWTRVYWRNASGERVYDPEDINPPEEVLALYENGAGERVGYRYATDQDDVPEGNEYVVIYDGEIVRDIELEGEKFAEDEKFEVLAFGTRRRAREASTALRSMMEPVPSDREELAEMDWDELVELAKPRGYNQNDGRETIENELAG